jgi:quercetin dioxygenase-like cupin family protein
MFSIFRTQAPRPYPERFAHRVTIHTSFEMPPSLVVQAWTFAAGAELRHGNDSYQGYDQHLAVIAGAGWVVGDDVARRPVQTGDLVVCPSGAGLVIDTDQALCLLAVSWDIDEDEEHRRRMQQQRLRVVQDALAGDHSQPPDGPATLIARVATPHNVTVEAWSIAAGGVFVHQADHAAATDHTIPVVRQANLIVVDGSGWVDGDGSFRERITSGYRVLDSTPSSARIEADTALTLIVVSGVW